MNAYAQLPQPSQCIDRPHLIDKLQQEAAHSILLVSAPPGYGKSTTIAQYLRQTEQAVVWYTLDARDRDGFLLDKQLRRHLANAVDLPVEQPHDLTGGRELAADLTDRLRTDLPLQLTLVLDDLHHIDGSASARRWLNALIKGMPAHCRLVLISRTLPELPFTQLLGDDRIGVIEKDDLAFTHTDISQLHAMYPTQSLDDLQQKINTYEGWTTGIMLSLRPVPAILKTQFDSQHIEKVFWSLAETLFEQQTPIVREFLMQSSVLPTFTPHICEDVLGMVRVHEPLASITQNRLFIEETVGGWRYHTLFQDYLQARLKQQTPGLYRQLHERVADWFEAQNEIEIAFEHYIESDNVDMAAHLAEKVAHTYLIRGRYDALWQFAACLATAPVSTPNLHLVLGIHALNRNMYAEAHQYLDIASEQFEEIGDVDMVYQVEIQRATIQVQQGNINEAIHQLEALHDLPDLPEKMRSQAMRVLGVAYTHAGETETAIAWLEDCLDYHEQVGDDLSISALLQDLQLAYLNGGYVGEAEHTLHRLVAIRRELGNPSELANALNNLGYYYYTCGDYRRAEEVFQEGLALVPAGSHNRFRAYLLWSYGDLLRDTGRFDEADPAYREALDVLKDKEPYLRFDILISFATLCQWVGASTEATKTLLDAKHLAEHMDMGTAQQIAEMHLMLDSSATPLNPQQAMQYAQRLQATRPEQKLPLMMATSQAAIVAGDTESAFDTFSHAVEIAVRLHQVRQLAAWIVYTQGLLTTLEPIAAQLEEIWRPICDLLELRKPRLHTPHITPTLVHRLKVQLFNKIEIERDGVLLTTSDWSTHKAEEMFLYLLFNGRTHREKLIEVFWPDSTSEKVRRSFHTTLNRARSAVGKDTLIHDNQWYGVNMDKVHIDCDALEFRKFVKTARHLSVMNTHTEDILRRAASLYQGPLMSTIYSDWAAPIQQEFEDLSVEVWVKLGDCARARCAVDETVGYYETALQEAPFREDVYRRLLSTLAAAGKRGELLKCWQRLQQLYQDEFGTDPSPQTRRLIKKLLV